jgi:hypothetical protein
LSYLTVYRKRLSFGAMSCFKRPLTDSRSD